jgi:phosphopantothenoylcysteine decarboxylase/phosphopantothenate--cysteine ligase
LVTFESGAELREHLQKLASGDVDAVFHAAAVGDFRFGKVWCRREDGSLEEAGNRKLSTRRGVLLAELVPTVKIIGELRSWFPAALLVGWKFEVDGGPAAAVGAGLAQLDAYGTNACVVNGPAYGTGFGLVTGRDKVAHCENREMLYARLGEFLQRWSGPRK